MMRKMPSGDRTRGLGTRNTRMGNGHMHF